MLREYYSFETEVPLYTRMINDGRDNNNIKVPYTPQLSMMQISYTP